HRRRRRVVHAHGHVLVRRRLRPALLVPTRDPAARRSGAEPVRDAAAVALHTGGGSVLTTTITPALFLLSASLPQAETDPYYGWLHPPRDGTAALNANINRALDDGLVDINEAPQLTRPRTCRGAAHVLTARLSSTAAYFFAGATRAWNVD